MNAMTFTTELDTGLPYLPQAALPLATDRPRDKHIVVGDPSDPTANADQH
jgi:hypothetical protein